MFSPVHVQGVSLLLLTRSVLLDSKNRTIIFLISPKPVKARIEPDKLLVMTMSSSRDGIKPVWFVPERSYW
jgi:hypothetical protein